MDDITRKHLEGMEARLTSKLDGINNGLTVKISDLPTRTEVTHEIREYFTRFTKDADRRHAELVRLLTRRFDAVPTRAESTAQLDELRAELAEEKEARLNLAAEVEELKRRLPPPPPPPSQPPT